MLQNESDGLDVDRAHRLGGKKTGRTRPLIIKCTYYKDKEFIIKNKRRLADNHTKVSVSEDYSKKTVGLQKTLYENSKAAKNMCTKIKTFYVNYKYVTIVYEYKVQTEMKNFRKNFNLSDMLKGPTDWFMPHD